MKTDRVVLPRILLVCPHPVATFVRQDWRCLLSAFDAILFTYKGWSSVASLWRAVRDTDCVVIWFAGRHALPTAVLANAARVPAITIVGGYEVAWVPEIVYGVPPRTLRERALRWMLNHSSRILTVSEFSHGEAARRFPRFAGRMTCIRNAIDTAVFQLDSTVTRRGVLSVGIISGETLARKSWPLFWETARQMPDVRFIAVGAAGDAAGRRLVAQCPPNLSWRGELNGDDLVREFQSASVYFQASRYESFSVATAEAMACGCVPVLSRNGALPEVGGDAAIYLDSLTPECAVRAVRDALAVSAEHRQRIRQRVVANFGLERRRRELVAAVEDVLSRPRERR